MKVLIVSNSISGGGAERTMRLVNAEFVASKLDSTLLCLNNSGGDTAKQSEVILERAWKTGIIGTFKNYLAFMKILKSQKPSTVIANCELPELFVALAPVRIKNLICVEHTSLPWAGRRPLGAAVRFLLLVRRASWVTVNRDQDGIWPFNNSVVHIPNPVEVPTLAQMKAGTSKFVFVGRLRPEKGIERILEAIAKAGTSIDVYGSGNLEGMLRRKFSSTAHFHGFVPAPWEKIYPDQTLIVASEYEGDGIVVVEGILAGLPMLLLDNLDLRRFKLPDENYFKDNTELVSKIKQAVMDPNHFRVEPEKISEYESERTMLSVITSWLELIW